MTTWELHITGRVQGVGFRPTVYRLARQYGITGTVCNGSDGVRVRFNEQAPRATAFAEAIINEPPRLARITQHSLREIPPQHFTDFQIVDSQPQPEANLLLSPDFALCADCRADITAFRNRRFSYPFTTCTNCGPRYAITQGVPYDRPLTTMAKFAMCPTCRAEYHDPEDRRHFSQTNSCPGCAISLLEITGGGARPLDAGLGTITAKWLAGQTIALKAMGGFLLTTDARNPKAIARLRERKFRPDKPLAVIYPSIEAIRADFFVAAAEAAALASPTGPIVLLRPRPGYSLEATGQLLAPGLDKVGVMLPSTPLLQLLLQDYGWPVVGTSGNRAGEPITFKESTAWEDLGDVADLIIGDDRPLLLPQDDSVVSFTTGGQQIIHRRARGLAPNFFSEGAELPTIPVFAAGADLKGSLGLLHNGNLYLSQYLGDLSSFTAQQHYRLTHRHLTNVLAAQPAAILCDLHPGYAASELAEAYATEAQVPLYRIQHHEAHLAAVLGEHQLTASPEPVLGIIWDGTGLGHDGQLWGGEFFRYQNQQMERVDHLPALPVLAGDQLARQPRLAALALVGDDPAGQAQLRAKFSDREWSLYQQLRRTTRLTTTSMGRVFDAVACLLGVCDRQSYEGMAASRLEALATSARTGKEQTPAWEPDVYPALLSDLRTCGPAQAALRFHLRLVDLVRQTAANHHCYHLAFSGGVFQNTLLVDLLTTYLGDTYQLYFHAQLPPNDENIAYGQLVHFALKQQHDGQRASKTIATCV